MFWFFLAIVLVIIVMIFIIPRLTFTPASYARNTAKTQMKCYEALKSSNPSANFRELVIMLLKQRPGYGDEDVKSFLKLTDDLCKDNEGEFDFQMFIYHFIRYDYRKLTGQSAWDHNEAICAGIAQAVPENYKG